MREYGGGASPPSPKTRRSHQGGPARNAHVDDTYGPAATKDARSLSRLPYQHSRWTTRHISHGIVTGEPGDRKRSRRVREGGAGKGPKGTSPASYLGCSGSRVGPGLRQGRHLSAVPGARVLERPPLGATAT